MTFKEFLTGENTMPAMHKHSANNGASNLASRSDFSDIAKAFWYAKDASSEAELAAKLEEYTKMQQARVVKVYVYGDGDDDFLEDRDDAEMLADPGVKVYPALAREIDGKLTLMSKDEMRQYFKNHSSKK